MEEATLWQAAIKVLITFVAVACIKEIDTFKFSRVYYLEALLGIA